MKTSINYNRYIDRIKEVEKINREYFLESLIDEYQKLVFSICYNLTKNYFDSEDLAQETFLAAYKAMDTFDGKNTKAWISKIATNKCLDYLKSASRKNLLSEENFFLELKSNELSPEESYLDREVKERINSLCKELKPPYDEIAKEYFCNGVTMKEISKKLDRPVKTVQTQVYRAKAMLQVLWRKEYQ